MQPLRPAYPCLTRGAFHERFGRGLAAFALGLLSIVASGCGRPPGDPNAPQDPDCLARATFGPPERSPYVLPFPPGRSYEVFQTYCGPVSHGRDLQMSIDFLMPLGAEVVAARSGTVRVVVDRHPNYERPTNRIQIEHDDGTSALYGHLQHDSARVAVGDRVETGQLIAASGSSGTSLPHLHFGVASSWPPRRPDDVPVNFRNARGRLDRRGGLERAIVYTATDVGERPGEPARP